MNRHTMPSLLRIYLFIDSLIKTCCKLSALTKKNREKDQCDITADKGCDDDMGEEPARKTLETFRDKRRNLRGINGEGKLASL